MNKALRTVSAALLAIALFCMIVISAGAEGTVFDVNAELKANPKDFVGFKDNGDGTFTVAAQGTYEANIDKVHNQPIEFTLSASMLSRSAKIGKGGDGADEFGYTHDANGEKNIVAFGVNKLGAWGWPGYVVILFSDGYELQRMTANEKNPRTYLIRNFEGPIVPMDQVDENGFGSTKTAKIRFSAVTVDNGVQVTLAVNDKQIFDFTDDSPLASKAEGPFFLYAGGSKAVIGGEVGAASAEGAAPVSADPGSDNAAAANPKTGDAGVATEVLIGGAAALLLASLLLMRKRFLR